MSKKSLPFTLYKTLENHARDSDIEDDDELQDIMQKLDDLNRKVEAFKEKARQKRIGKANNVVSIKHANSK
ncbi:hypothetical protein ISG33_07610 [Glaciecola sp. MH2013]|uniref:hypothetical protein n=1 Tax=Glaciecola sp. MH2013 TaxID=2785524 RepID=UPI00189E6B54|nr:hypothetical protein [Glaciecola sp. MH2013]MBF7073259.1 hypothetical protein [Glaciecola sp. MH2013]